MPHHAPLVNTNGPLSSTLWVRKIKKTRIKEARSQIPDLRSQVGWRRAGGSTRQGSEVGRQKTEDKHQRSEVRSQTSEVRHKRSEVRSQKSEVRSQKRDHRSTERISVRATRKWSHRTHRCDHSHAWWGGSTSTWVVLRAADLRNRRFNRLDVGLARSLDTGNGVGH